jgi:hypothetical protein
VSPLVKPDRGHVELTKYDIQMSAERQAEAFEGIAAIRDLVQRQVEGGRSGERYFVKEVLLPAYVGVDRRLANTKGLGQVANRGAVVTTLGEETRCLDREAVLGAHPHWDPIIGPELRKPGR